MSKDFRLSCSACTKAMVACSRASCWAEALQLFHRQRPDEDIGCVAAAIRACGYGLLWEEALMLIKDAQLQGLRLNLKARHALLGSLGEAAQWPLSLAFLEDRGLMKV
eukprot:g2711.t1